LAERVLNPQASEESDEGGDDEDESGGIDKGEKPEGTSTKKRAKK
jgi:hypothetical protein